MPTTLTPTPGGLTPASTVTPPPMPAVTPTRPTPAWPFRTPVELRPLSVDEYHRMADHGILTTADRIELLHGYMVYRMTIKPPHAAATIKLYRWLDRRLPAEWTVRSQQPVTFL